MSITFARPEAAESRQYGEGHSDSGSASLIKETWSDDAKNRFQPKQGSGCLNLPDVVIKHSDGSDDRGETVQDLNPDEKKHSKGKNEGNAPSMNEEGDAQVSKSKSGVKEPKDSSCTKSDRSNGSFPNGKSAIDLKPA